MDRDARDGPDRDGSKRAGPLRLKVDGSTRSATIEMAFRNFADTWPADFEIVADDEGDSAEGDVVVHLRTPDPPPVGEVRATSRRPVIYAMDDDLFRVFADPARQADTTAVVEAHLRNADFVFVYAEALAVEVARINPRVAVLRMNVPRRYLAAAAASNPLATGRTRYLIIGRLVRSPEFRRIGHELREFFIKHADRAELTVFASEPMADRYRQLLGDLPFALKPLAPYREFRDGLIASNYDFVINPLLDTPFNRSKSPVKHIEAALAGAVLITSDMPVYGMVRHGETGLVVPWRKRAWAEALRHSLKMAEDKRARVRSAARHDVEEHLSTEANRTSFVAAIEAARLHAALGSRQLPDGIPVIVADRPMPEIEQLLSHYAIRLVAASEAPRNQYARLAFRAVGDASHQAGRATISVVTSVDNIPAGAAWPDAAVATSPDIGAALRRAGCPLVFDLEPDADSPGQASQIMRACRTALGDGRGA